MTPISEPKNDVKDFSGFFNEVRIEMHHKLISSQSGHKNVRNLKNFFLGMFRNLVGDINYQTTQTIKALEPAIDTVSIIALCR